MWMANGAFSLRLLCVNHFVKSSRKDAKGRKDRKRKALVTDDGTLAFMRPQAFGNKISRQIIY
jgi:hypothetical protein